MFEKEAEEYVKKTRHDVTNWDGAEPEERFYNEIKFKQAYLAGAEFGYSKANEWHYVKDGDLPSDRHGHVVINQDWDKVTIRNGRFEYLDGYKANVITWKEIKLPNESK